MDTPNLGLALLDAAQAQKHVTVNEALLRLDALAQARILSASLADPPASPGEGAVYLVPAAATGVWIGQTDTLALWSNGGWMHIAPQAGWRVHVVDAAETRVFDGARWVSGGLAIAAAATGADVLSVDHVLSAGPDNGVAAAIPDRSIVLGVTARVIAPIFGPTSWRLGVDGALDRYGSGLGVAQNSEAHGITGAPVGYYGDTALRLTADGGDFVSGTIRLAVHRLVLTPPSLV